MDYSTPYYNPYEGLLAQGGTSQHSSKKEAEGMAVFGDIIDSM